MMWRRLLMCVLLMWPTAALAQVSATSSVVVLPFDNPGNEPRLHWLREGAAILVGARLAAQGTTVVDRIERTTAFERLQLPAFATLSRASVIKVGQVVGATTVVVGGVGLAGDQLTIRARLIRIDAGRLLPEVVEQGPLADLFAMTDRVVAALSRLPVGAATQPSLQAFEFYVKGLVAETPATAQSFLDQALKAAPRDDRVRLALWQLHTEQARHQRAFDIVSGVAAGAAEHREARFCAALSLISLKREDEAFQALRALQTEQAAAAVVNALGVVQLRRGATPSTGRATYFFNQATELAPPNGDYFFNLGYAYWLDKDAAATIHWLREAVRREPGDGDAHFVLSAALQQTGATAEARRERELAGKLSSTRYAAWAARAAAGGALIPRGLERLNERLEPPVRRTDTIITTAGQRDQAAAAAFHLDVGRRAFVREADREAIEELRRALYLSPYLAEAHLLLGRLYLRGGRTDDAVQALKIALWSEETVPAHLVLAEAYMVAEDPTAARAEVDRALALEPANAEALQMRLKVSPPR